MEVAVLRMLTTWLGHATYGVNALQAVIPRGADPAPAAVQLITDETQDDRVALGQLPEGPYPCLVGSLRPLFEQEPAQVNGPLTAGQIVALWQYGIRSLDPDVGTRDAYRTLRAVAKSLAYLMLQAETARTQDEVQITELEGIRLLAVFTPLEDGLLIGGVEVRARAMDRWTL